MRKSSQTVAKIQKEQLFLVQLERELANVLGKINENINTLKVEELQLRSNAINNLKYPEPLCVPEQTQPALKSEEQIAFVDNPEMVNQQELNLDIYLSHFNDEEDDE